MKTLGLTLIEAERARVAGVCRTYRSELWPDSLVFNGNYFEQSGDVEYTFRLSTHDILATDYRLINPVLPTKEVSVEAWAIIGPDDSIRTFTDKEPACISEYAPGSRMVKLTGVDMVPVEEPVRKEWVFTEVVWSETSGGYQFPICHGNHPPNGFVSLRGKTGTLTFVEDPQ